MTAESVNFGLQRTALHQTRARRGTNRYFPDPLGSLPLQIPVYRAVVNLESTLKSRNLLAHSLKKGLGDS